MIKPQELKAGFTLRTGRQLFLGGLLILFLSVILVGCGTGQKAQVQTGKLSQANPLVVDQKAKTVKVYAEINGKYFYEPTRHAIVFKDGSNGDKSILKAFANHNDFYQALMQIGAQPGNNVTLDTKDAVVGGEQLDVLVTWEGANKEIPFNDIVLDSTGKTMDVRFGGNQERAREKNTGCILCLDSCPVGITSNAAHPQNSFKNKKVEFKGNKDILPADGTPVTVIFKIKQ